MSDLSYKLSSYVEAIETLKKGQDNCQYDAGYFLQRERDEVKRIEEAFLDELLNCLDTRRKERLVNNSEQDL